MGKDGKISPSGQPKYARIVAEIRDQIVAGSLKAGDRLPPERELAKQFQVSRLTLRAALEELDKSGFLNRSQGSGNYVADINAQKDLRICLVFHQSDPDREDPFYQYILTGLSEAFGNGEINFNMLNISDPKNLQLLNDMTAGKLANPPHWNGMLFTGCRLDDEDIIALRKMNTAMVAFHPHQGRERISYVDMDNFGGAYMAIQHLLNLGRKRILVINGPMHVWHVVERRKGALQAFADQEIEPDPELLIEVANWGESLDQALPVFLDKKIPFDAVFCHTGTPCIKIWHALHDYGFKIPDDLAMVMYDDYPHVHSALPIGITAVKQPFDQMARIGAQVLLDQIENPDIGVQTRYVPTRLIIRDSCGAKTGGPVAVSPPGRRERQLGQAAGGTRM